MNFNRGQSLCQYIHFNMKVLRLQNLTCQSPRNNPHLSFLNLLFYQFLQNGSLNSFKSSILATNSIVIQRQVFSNISKHLKTLNLNRHLETISIIGYRRILHIFHIFYQVMSPYICPIIIIRKQMEKYSCRDLLFLLNVSISPPIHSFLFN